MIKEILDEGNKNEQKLEDLLVDVLWDDVDDVTSFDNAGIMTNNNGVVVSYKGKEFQLTIVESR